MICYMWISLLLSIYIILLYHYYNNDYNITINYNYNPFQKLCLFKYNYIYVITSYHCRWIYNILYIAIAINNYLVLEKLEPTICMKYNYNNA